MFKIMFVCLGNICRSPMAEMIFSQIAKDNNMENFFKVSSSATCSDEIICGVGNPLYLPAKRELMRNNIEIIPHRATLLKASDYDNYDLFVGMEDRNIRDMKVILNGDKKGKVKKLMDFTSGGGNVADPWYTGDFSIAYNDIFEGCNCLFEYLKKSVIK